LRDTQQARDFLRGASNFCHQLSFPVQCAMCAACQPPSAP
jgi:hypothetical protein